MKMIRYRIKLLKMLWKYTQKKKYLILILCLALLIAGMGFLQPLFYQIFITDVILGGNTSAIWMVIVGYLGVQIILWAAYGSRVKCQYHIQKTAISDIKYAVLEKYFKINYAECSKINAGKVKMAIDENMEALNKFYETQGADFYVKLLECAVIMIILFVFHWKLAALAVLLLPWTFLIDFLISRREQVYSQGMIQNHAACANWLNTYIKNWKEYRAFCMENNNQKEFEKFVYNDMKYFCPWMKFWVTRYWILPKLRNEFLLQFALYFFGGLLIFRGEISIGLLLVFAQYYVLLMDAIQFLVTGRGDLISQKKVFDTVIEELEIDQETVEKKNGHYVRGDIEVDNLSFRYEINGANIFSKFFCYIKQGEHVGIIGESGRGKSTFIKLLSGILNPTGGEIRIGGINLQDIPSQELFKHIGIVSQDTKLFNASIYENLRYGKNDISFEEMREACQRAQIASFIESLPEMYETIIGDNGIKLSGGQKQRLALARLFLQDVDICILDEATSALDRHTEDAIQREIEKYSDNKTLIVVSHRKSSLEFCDRILEI